MRVVAGIAVLLVMLSSIPGVVSTITSLSGSGITKPHFRGSRPQSSSTWTASDKGCSHEVGSLKTAPDSPQCSECTPLVGERQSRRRGARRSGRRGTDEL